MNNKDCMLRFVSLSLISYTVDTVYYHFLVKLSQASVLTILSVNQSLFSKNVKFSKLLRALSMISPFVFPKIITSGTLKNQIHFSLITDFYSLLEIISWAILRNRDTVRAYMLML